MKSVSELIIDALKTNGGTAKLHQIYSYMENHKNEVNMHAKDNKKTLRGILSRMKKAKIVEVLDSKKSLYRLISEN